MPNIKFEQRNSSKIFLSIFLPFYLCILISLLVLSYILYSNFERVALKQVYNFQKNDLQSISHSLSNMMASAKALSVQAFFDSDISNLLYYDYLETEEYTKAQLRMQSYKNSNPFLYSIYVYNGRNIYIEPSNRYEYGKDNIADIDILDILSNMRKYPSHSLIPRKLTDDISDNKAPRYVYSYLFYDSQLRSGKISEAIILNISENWLRSSIDSIKHSSSDSIFIIDETGKLVISDTKNPMLFDLSTNKYIRNILSSDESSSYFRTEVDGRDSFVAYVKTGICNYTFISVTPYAQIVNSINTMRKITYFIVSLLALIVVLITLFLSQRLYNPIKSILQKLNSLESDNKHNFQNRKQEYLRTLVKGSSSFDTKELEKNFKYYNIKLKLSESLLMVIVKIDGFSDFCDKYNLVDRNLMKFCIMNISSELCAEHYENECIDIGEDHIIILINYNSSDSPKNNTAFMQIIHSIQDNIEKHLRIKSSITMSESFEGINTLNNIYSSALDASYYRLVLGHRCIIFANEIPQLPSSDFKYPVEKEKHIWESIKLGRSDDAKDKLWDIFNNASAFGFPVLNVTIMHFLLSLGNTIEALKVNNRMISDYNFGTLPNQLNKLETLDEIKEMFSSIFDKLCAQPEQNTEIKHQKLLDTAVDIINKEYSRHDLSLDTISERLGISTSYLSRLFKKYKEISIVDYVNNIRLEKAKELINTSDDPVNVIMEKTGFTSRSHFYTLFKKAYGFSPGNMKFSNKINTSSQE